MKIKPLSDRVVIKMVEAEENHQKRNNPFRLGKGESPRWLKLSP